MPTYPPELTPRQWELVAAYRAGDRTVAKLLKDFGATRSELDTALSRAREPFRRPASASPARNLRRRAPVDVAALHATGEHRLELRLARLLAARVAELEDPCGPGRSADPEANARALSLSVSTLAALRRAEGGWEEQHNDIDGTPHDEPPRSLAALRDELYGHLQRIRDEERAGGGAGCAAAHAGGDGGSAAPLAGPLPPEPAPP